MRQKLAQAITAYGDEQITASDLKDFLTRHQEEISQLPEKDIKAVAEWMNARIGPLEHDVRKDRVLLVPKDKNYWQPAKRLITRLRRLYVGSNLSPL